jgi:hypothetical protein
MTTFPYPLSLHAQDSFRISQLKTALREPLFVTAVGLFWLTALPIGALFSTAIAAYDKMASLKSRALRMPYLRGNAATNPLLLKRKDFALRNANTRTSERNQAVRV